jgi:hypothetical protein
MAERLAADQHVVAFYADDTSLFSTVGAFLHQGLVDRHPAIVIATDAHARGILRNLQRRGIDVRAAVSREELIVMPTEHTLASFVTRNGVDANAFVRIVGSPLERMVRRHRGSAVVHAYGEMVNLLWSARRPDAAIAVERLWNDLILRCHFSLLCGYAMSMFDDEPETMERVCAQHTHVLPPSTDLEPGLRQQFHSC